jgi:tetratricopeptide (TPR) repeat protein
MGRENVEGIMTVLRTTLFLLILLCTSPGWALDRSSPADDDAKLAQQLDKGTQLLSSGKPREAIVYFDKVASAYEGKFRDSKAVFYCARWQVESLMYLLEAAKEKKGKTQVVSPNWAYAYYYKAYSLLDLGHVSEAKALLERAIALSPRNSQFLSELGHCYQLEKNWPMALQTFQSAEAAAGEFSPPEMKNNELSRALRGIGYSLIEQNRLDEAEKIYRQCLEINKNDSKAMNELRYIEGLKARQGGRQ